MKYMWMSAGKPVEKPLVLDIGVFPVSSSFLVMFSLDLLHAYSYSWMSKPNRKLTH